MRVVALVAARNEERFIEGCLKHLIGQGVEVFLIDNGSVDDTIKIAKRYEGQGLIGVEHFPWDGTFRWRRILERKEELAMMIDADWFIHCDPDEVRLPPRSDTTLVKAFTEADQRGYNAVNFIEFTFVPTQESPDHDNSRYAETMLSYYPFLPRPRHRVNAWKRQPCRVRIADSGGHDVNFPSINISPLDFPMKHYLFLSIDHAIRKYSLRNFDADEVEREWHGGRPYLRPADMVLSSRLDLREYVDDYHLDASVPRTTHVLFDLVIQRRRT
jgi:glycosyltransferase involved in cell wall biosynthesis